MRFRHMITALCGVSTCITGVTRADAQQPDRLPQIYTMTPTGVNLQSGTFMRSKTDLAIGSLNFVRSWEAHSPDPHKTLSANWTHNFLLGARIEGNNGMTVFADGKTYQFRVNPQGVWQPWNIDQFNTNGMGAELTGTINGPLTFRNQNGDVHTINASRRTTRVDLADGTRVDLGYDALNRLRTVISNRGDAIVLDYNTGGRIQTACGYNIADAYVGAATTCAASGLKVGYAYSAATNPLLASVTDLSGTTTSFRYEGNNLTCITVPGTQTCEVTNFYGPQGDDPALTMPNQVRRQVMATGEQWSFFYLNQNLNEMPRQPGQVFYSSAEATDPMGNTIAADYENGQVRSLYTPEGGGYEWNGLYLKSFTAFSGRKQVLGYDRRGNVLSSRRVGPGEADITSATGYPDDNSGFLPTGCIAASQKLCNKPMYRIAPNGIVGPNVTLENNPYRTDYTYDPAHGMVLTETGPAVGGVRPQKRYRYEQRYAGVKNSAGAIVQAASPVWLLVEEAMCKTGAAPACVGTADEVRTLYEYGASGTANALRLKGRVVDHGSGRLNLRTCYAYDAQGNKVSETTPRAGLAACP